MADMVPCIAGYHDYFDTSVDVEACVYLMLANKLVHEVHSNAITIAEEVSGMPSRLTYLCESCNATHDVMRSLVPPD